MESQELLPAADRKVSRISGDEIPTGYRIQGDVWEFGKKEREWRQIQMSIFLRQKEIYCQVQKNYL